MNVFIGLMIPFLGTALGAACVFFLKKEMPEKLKKTLLGFASGVMVAASVWSLIIPSMNSCEHMGKFAFVPAAVGIILGFAFLLILDMVIPHLHANGNEEGPKSKFKQSTKLCLAVTLHNIPEGMAVGVVYASFLAQGSTIGIASVFALSIGIAIQNFPEGAIISMPMASEGKLKSFFYGILSGIVEPVSAFLTILLASFVQPILPYLLSFSAGAMLYVVVEELIPDASEGNHSNLGTIGFALGFIIMMILDVFLG